MSKIVLITGAAGNIGSKVTAHLQERGDHELRLLDRKSGANILSADFGEYSEDWAGHFDGVDTVIHFAGNPSGRTSWASAKRDNIGGTIHVLRASRAAGVRRVVFASTNQVMLGYRFQTGPVTTDLPPAPLSPYGISKFTGEEIGRAFQNETGIEFLALRIGYFQAGENQPGAHMSIGEWGQSMWLSNRDMNQAIDRAIEAPNIGFAVVNLVSNNLGMRWDIEHTRRTLGYVPLDMAQPEVTERTREMDRVARAKTILPGQWFDENFEIVAP